MTAGKTTIHSSQLRLDHLSVALVDDVTSVFYANYYADRPHEKKMADLVAPQKTKPVSKDVLLVEMLWIIQGKA